MTAMTAIAGGFAIEPRRIVAEVVSGSVAAMERPGFARLVVKCLALGDTDLTSAAGKMIMQIISAKPERARKGRNLGDRPL